MEDIFLSSVSSHTHSSNNSPWKLYSFSIQMYKSNHTHQSHTHTQIISYYITWTVTVTVVKLFFSPDSNQHLKKVHLCWKRYFYVSLCTPFLIYNNPMVLCTHKMYTVPSVYTNSTPSILCINRAQRNDKRMDNLFTAY